MNLNEQDLVDTMYFDMVIRKRFRSKITSIVVDNLVHLICTSTRFEMRIPIEINVLDKISAHLRFIVVEITSNYKL